MIDVAQPAPHAGTTIPTITTRAWTFALFGKGWAIAKGGPPSQKGSQVEAIRDACISFPGRNNDSSYQPKSAALRAKRGINRRTFAR
jgi:hypothetical protein